MNERLAKPLPLVMSHPVVALRPHDTVVDALATANEHAVHHFPVCIEERVVGMVCTCDFRDASPNTAVGSVMRPAVTLPDIRSTTDAAALMKAALVGSILVVDFRGAPCGIVTRGDLLGEVAANHVLQTCKCTCCGAADHLRSYNGSVLCVSCLDRATEPEAFETGGGD